MEKMNTLESLNCVGGAFKLVSGITFVISGIVTFLLGVYDGMTNPKACNVR